MEGLSTSSLLAPPASGDEVDPRLHLSLIAGCTLYSFCIAKALGQVLDKNLSGFSEGLRFLGRRESGKGSDVQDNNLIRGLALGTSFPSWGWP